MDSRCSDRSELEQGYAMVLFADDAGAVSLPIWVAIAGTVVTLVVVPLFTLLVNSWLNIRKQRIEALTKATEVEVMQKRETAVIFREDREEDQRIRQIETDNALGNYKSTMLQLLAERKKAHDTDIKRVETLLGEMGRKLDICERKHSRKDRLLIQLIERMKGAGELSDTEVENLYARMEEDSNDPDGRADDAD